MFFALSSLLVISALTMPEADAVKAKGSPQSKLTKSYGMKNSNVVCGDKLCSQIGSSADQQSRFQVGGVMQQDAIPTANKVPLSPELKAKRYTNPYLKQQNVCSLTDSQRSYADLDGDGLRDNLEPSYFADPTKFDTDGDGLSDKDEICFGNKSKPNDVDSDDDGINDAQDQCRMSAETVNGYQDTDGCPDTLDQDNDTILDSVDNCPTVANTNQLNTDGDSMGNACDTDDDNDGKLDSADSCPLQAETVNGYQDTDGCPDVLDTTRPSVTITSSITNPTSNPGPYQLTITFSEPVTGLTESDFLSSYYGMIISPGTLSTTDSITYTMYVTLGMTPGFNSIQLPDGKVQDAAGNTNTFSNQIYTNLVLTTTIPSISGTKYYDSNADHNISGESTLSGITIGIFQPGFGSTPIATTTTDASGYYEFTNVPVSSDRYYVICEILTHIPSQGQSYPWGSLSPTGTIAAFCPNYPNSAPYGYNISYSYTGPTTGLDFGNNRTAP